ncbi:Ig-like domain-containing protein [Candidatus Roizmanbacteria bacterium]|nr:Ig-like domain-containing protein [Candidatus Roizmanbacteria bacterium]
MVRIPGILLILLLFWYLLQPVLTPPKIVVTFPGNDGIEVPLTSTIEVQFDKKMHQGSVQSAFSLTPEVVGAFSWEGESTLIFTPAEQLVRNQEYAVDIGRFALSSYFIPKISSDHIVFTTLGHPHVVLASPQTEAPSGDASITVIFDRPMVTLTTAAEKEQFQAAFTISPTLSGEGRWLGTTAYQFRPDEVPQAATTYTYKVPVGLSSEDGGSIQEDTVFSFSTERPHIQSTSPLREYGYANPVASVSATLNLPIDPESAKNAFHLIHFKDGKEEEVSMTIKFVGKQQIGMYPAKPLIRSDQYGARIDAGLTSTSGPNGLETPYTWEFVIAPVPKAVRTLPEHGGKDIEEEHSIDVYFASPMDQNSFKENVSIDPPPDRDPSLYFSSYENNHTLHIGTYLGRSTTYTIRISGNVKDQYGVRLGSDYVFSFSTSAYKPSVSIVPPNTYFASFNQQVIPRIVAKVVNADSVQYRLYKLSREQFLDFYRRRYVYNAAYSKEERTWQTYPAASLTLIREWKESYSSDHNVPVHVITKVTKNNGGLIDAGLYFLDVSLAGGAHDNIVMVVGNTTLTLKTSPEQAFVWAVNQSDGGVVADASVEIVSLHNNVLTKGTTNKDGVFQADVSIRNERESYIDSQNPIFAFAAHDADTAVVADVWQNGIAPYEFGLTQYWDPHESDSYKAAEQLKLYLLLDRPIYRPGQRVYYKGVVRRDDDGAYQLLNAGESVTVVATDAEGQQVTSQSAPLTSFGTFSGYFDIAAKGSVGYYSISATISGNGFTQQFQVEEYRRPDFSVTVSTGESDYVDGDAVPLTIDAQFFFGAPVADAPIRWIITTQDDPYRWEKDRRFEFGDSDDYWYRPWWSFYSDSFYSGKTVAEGTGETSRDGSYVVNLPTNITDKTSNQRMRMEAVVTDQSNQAIGASGEFVVHQAGVHVGLKPERYSGRAGEESRVEVVAIDIDGKEQANIPVAISVFRRIWNSVREKNPDDGQFYWVSKPTDEPISSFTVTTGQEGRATASFTPSQGGTYRIVGDATDVRGKTSRSATSVWVSGAGGTTTRQENHDRIVLVPDKQEYQIGETARVHAVLPYEQTTGLITVERGSVFDYTIVHTTIDNQTVSLPIQDRYSPNAFIAALFVKAGKEVKDPAQFKMGLAEIRVSDPRKQVKVSLTPKKKQYGPGETMEATITTVDGTGKPVATELAVALVDKAVWSLARAELADIYQTFYRPRNLSVFTSSGLTVSMDRINANVNLGSKGGSGGGCFTAETPVLMSNGISKRIDQVAVGDRVLTRKSESSSELVQASVDRIFIHDVDGYLVVNDTLRVTPVHRIFTSDGWKMASQLQVGDKLLDARNEWIRVDQIQPVREPVRVYNLTVQTYNTYFAGGVWVHNQKGGPDTTREKFLDTAYWDAHITTDEKGAASVSIPLPDNLTTWRFLGVAVSRDTAVGDAIEDVLVTKNVLIQPLLPRFLSVGDVPLLGMVVHNTTTVNQKVRANLTGEGIVLVDPPQQEKVIPAGSSHKFYWKTATVKTEEATIRMEAVGNEGMSDAVKLTLPVVSYYTPETVATSGEVQSESTEKVFLPADIVPDQGELRMSLAPSLGGEVQDAASYLFSYPYWCNEQTVNRLLPAAYLLRLAKVAQSEKVGGYSPDQLKKFIEDAISRLMRTQRPDGGWGWWETYESNPAVSAMVMEGLVAARDAKLAVSDEMINSGNAYLESVLAGKKESLETQSFVASVIARTGDVDGATLSRLMDSRWEMGLLGKVYLLRALQEGKGTGRDTNRLFDELISQVHKTNTTSHWEDKRSEWYLMGNNNTITSLMLEALTVQNKRHPLISEVTRWLIQARDDSHWQSTRDTAAAVRAIVTMLLMREEGTLDEAWSLDVNTKQVGSGSFKKGELLKRVEEMVVLGDLPKEVDIPVTLKRSGKGSLYYNMNLRYFLPFEQVKPLDQGIVLMRELVDKKGKLISQDTVTAGEEIWTRLIMVAPSTLHHVIIEDMLPAGLEAVNESLATTSLLTTERIASSEDTNQLYFRHREIRDDRVVLFAETVAPGVYEYRYRVRPTSPGRYHHPPARAYNMYIPDISGHSSGGWLEVLDE